MVLMIAGSILAALGLFAGVVLVAAALGFSGGAPGVSLWVLFPLLAVVGYLLLATVASGESARRWLLAVSSLMLVLALASAAGLVLLAASVLDTGYGAAPLWYVLVVAGAIGTIGAASHHKSGRTQRVSP